MTGQESLWSAQEVRTQADQCAGQVTVWDALETVAGWISAPGGKWHRATVAEPTFAHDETTACGVTFRPLNVTWNGDTPPTSPAYLCKRAGCAA